MATEDDADDGVGMDLTGAKAAKVDPEPAEDEDTEDSAEEEEWKPPTREEYEALVKERDELDRVRAKAATEAKKRREESVRLRKQQRSAKATADKSGDQDDHDAADQAERATEEAMRRYKPAAVRNAAIAALVKADFQQPTDSRLDRMVQRLNMDEIDVDLDTGRVDGLDEQIEELREEFPELFTKPPEPAKPEPKPTRPRAGRITGADRKNEAPTPKTTGEKHMARIFGSGT